MTYNSLNQKGFAALEAILIVVILAMIGGTGFYVYNSNKKASDTYNSATKVSQSSPAQKTSSKAQFFTIPEWGVKAKYTGDLSLNYAVKSSDISLLKYAAVSSTQLDAADTACKGGGYGGLITRYKSTDHFLVGDGEVDSGKTAAETAASLDRGTYGHVGDYYYFYISPQGECAQAAQTVQAQTMKAVKALVPKLEVAPAS